MRNIETIINKKFYGEKLSLRIIKYTVPMESTLPKTSLTRDFTWMTIAYIFSTLLMAVAGKYAFDAGWTTIWTLAAADTAGTLGIFFFSYWRNNSSFYDAYWSVWPPLAALFTGWLGMKAGADPMRIWAIGICVWLWGIRLTSNWARGWHGLQHEDWRYVDMRRTTKGMYWLTSLTGLHYFPTLLVFLGCLPMYAAMSLPGKAFNALDIVATVICIGATLIEFIADEQLRQHRRQNPGKSITTGLWSYSRHPNYFGEMSFWWGLYIFALAAGQNSLWMIAGAVSMTLLFVFISIPMMEKRMLERKPDYKEVQQKIYMLVPFFRKK